MAVHRIPQEVLEEIQSRIDIAAVIGDFVALKKSGKDFKGLCPFHPEKTPSFMVSPDKGIFHCFGCGEGGNIFKFLMKRENLTFPEVVQKLALKAGVDLEALADPKEVEVYKEKEVFYKINRYAAWFYSERLQKEPGNTAEKYLKQRKINAESSQKFQLGFAPDSWDTLTHFFQSKKVPLDKVEKLGLIRRGKSGGYYDFFRNRLMFPIMDAQDRVIGFSSRKLKEEDVGGKYVNSSESPVYHKGDAVYGLSQAREALRKTNRVILVEGNLDLIRLHQAGIANAVAPLGTSLTANQIKLLGRHAEAFTLMFDGDEAGYKASLKALELFLKEARHPYFVPLPEGLDPDSTIEKHGSADMEQRIQRAKPFIEWLLEEELSKSGIRTDQRVKAAEKIDHFISLLPEGLASQAYRARIKRFIGIDEGGAVSAPLRTQSNFKTNNGAKVIEKKLEKQKNSLERILLQFYLKFPGIVSGLVTSEIIENFDDFELKSLGLKIASHYETFGEIVPIKLQVSEEALSTVAELLMQPLVSTNESEVKNWVEDTLKSWRTKKLKEELRSITRKIHVAELNHDQDELNALMEQKAKLNQQIIN